MWTEISNQEAEAIKATCTIGTQGGQGLTGHGVASGMIEYNRDGKAILRCEYLWKMGPDGAQSLAGKWLKRAG